MILKNWYRHVGVISLGLVTPGIVSATNQPDTAVVHSIYAGKQLQDLLGSIAESMPSGAFTRQEAEKIQGEIWKLAADVSSSPGGQVTRNYGYLVQSSEEHQAVLTFSFLSTRNHIVDVTIVSDPKVMRLARASLGKLGVDSIIPFDRIRLTLTEERISGAEPRPVLNLWTIKEFGCLGYYIDHDLRQTWDTLLLNLHGVSPPLGPCPAMIGPARMARRLPTGAKTYALVVSYGTRSDRLVLNISDTATVVTGLDSTLVEADERPRWRYPRNSFAFHCSNVNAFRRTCDDVERWLEREPGITRLSIPGGWIDPYNPDPASHPDRRTTLFRYEGDQKTFERLRLCFGAIDNQLRETVGMGMALENWQGSAVSARSRKALHEPHVKMPERVTLTSACRTPRWVYQPRAE